MFKWACLILFLLFVYHVREVFPPFIMGGIIAYLLNPLVKYLCKNLTWLRPGYAIAIIYLGTIAIVSCLCAKFGPTVVDEAKNLVEQRHQLTHDFVQQIAQQFPQMGLDAEKVTREVLLSAENSAKPAEIVHVGGVISKSLLAILVCTVSSIYFILDSTRVGKFFLRFVPHDKKVTVVNLSSQMNVMLSKYVSGQLILILLMSFVAFWVLYFCGIKYALVIAIVAGVMEIIPVLGPLLAIVIATGVAVAQHGFVLQTVAVPICFFVARQLEDYVVVPRVIGHAVELHPLAVIFAVLVGETMGGALGMLVAIPVAASIKLILDFVYPPDPNDEKHHEKHGGMIAGLVNLFLKPSHSHEKQEKPASHITVPQVDQEPSHASTLGTLGTPVGTVLQDRVIKDPALKNAMRESSDRIKALRSTGSIDVHVDDDEPGVARAPAKDFTRAPGKKASALPANEVATAAKDAPATEKSTTVSKEAPVVKEASSPAKETAEAAPPAQETAAMAKEASPPGKETAAMAKEAAPPGKETAAMAKEAAPPGKETAAMAKEASPPAKEAHVSSKDLPELSEN